MAKPKRTPRPKAETPRGFRDYFGHDVVARQRMLDAITGVYHAYGFDPLESPAVETVEALGKFLPDIDRPNEGVFAWQDEDETWLALRYDLTAPLARVFAQHRRDLPSPYRRYAVGPVWRNEKPGPGRFRQFYQCDADTVGAANVAADAEICMMLADALEAVGISPMDFVIRVNNRKVLNGMLDSIGIGSVDFELREAVLRTIDKFDKVCERGVLELLTTGRKDASGAYIDGVGLDVMNAQRIVQYLSQRSVLEPGTNAARLASMRQAVADSPEGNAGVDELTEIVRLTEAQGYGPDRIIVDSAVVRGLGYYTGPVYEAELTFEITDEDGRRRQFGSVAGGGRYDDLVKRFTGETVPATGVSIGVDRLLAALSAIGRAGAGEAEGPVVILPMDRERMADYQTMCAELRRAGIRAEVFLGGGNMARQLKYADRRASPVAVIEGGDERASGQVTLKDLALGARLASEIETREEWTAQPAQVTVPRAELIEQVRRMLARPRGEAG